MHPACDVSPFHPNRCRTRFKKLLRVPLPQIAFRKHTRVTNRRSRSCSIPILPFVCFENRKENLKIS